MLLVPITARANFWAMKFISLVDFEQEKKPIALAAVRVAGGPEPVGGAPERFVPDGRTQLAVVAHERLR